MEWTYPLDGGRGRVSVRAEGARAAVRVRMADDGRGLYKVWLLGRRGEAPLGALLPEEGELRLARALSVARLEQQGAWPPSGARVQRTFTFGQSPPRPTEQGPLGFTRAEPERVLGDPVLRACGGEEPLWSRTRGDQTLLLLPFSPRRPVPLLPAVCLMGAVEREGKRWLALRLDGRGWPILPPPGEEELF